MAKEDWQKIWQEHNLSHEEDEARLKDELGTIRWRKSVDIARGHLGNLKGLTSIEIGAGLGDFSILFNWLGVKTTLADYSTEAIAKARKRFSDKGLVADFVKADMLDVSPDLRDRFDLSFSLGLAEHFKGEERRKMIESHALVLKKGGITLISVPYKYSFPYRFWMWRKKIRGNWEYGYEKPFSKRELKYLAESSGLQTLGFVQSSFFTDWNNFFPHHRVKNGKTEKAHILDYFGYALVYIGKK